MNRSNNRHKWIDAEVSVIRANKDMPAAYIKTRFFGAHGDISVKAIQRKKDLMRGEDLTRNNAPVEQWELDLIRDNMKMKNSELSDRLQRKPDDIDKMRHRIKAGLGNRLNLPTLITDHKGWKKVIKHEEVPVVPTEALLEEVNRTYRLIDELKSISPAAIEIIRGKRKSFHNNPEPVQVYDYLKVPTSDDIASDSFIHGIMSFVTDKIQDYNKISLEKTLGGPTKKKTTISTHQFNLLRQFLCLRITSHRNLNIQNNVTELRNLLSALTDYYNSVEHGSKVIPSKKPIKRKRKEQF